MPRFRLLGTAVDAIDRDRLIDEVASAANRHASLMVLNHNMHSLALCQKDPGLRQFFESADLIVIDGQPVVTIAQRVGHPIDSSHRLAVLDWFWPMMDRAAAEGWRVLHVGSHAKTIAEATRRIAQRQPDVDFVTIHGYFDKRPGSRESAAVVEQIRSYDPDVILLGMGMPIQEHWLRSVYDSLPSCPVITVGGILGFIGGERPTAPRWMGPVGIEWVYRLVTEPRRLWSRYLLEPWVLALPLAREIQGRHQPYDTATST